MVHHFTGMIPANKANKVASWFATPPTTGYRCSVFLFDGFCRPISLQADLVFTPQSDQVLDMEDFHVVRECRTQFKKTALHLSVG